MEVCVYVKWAVYTARNTNDMNTTCTCIHCIVAIASHVIEHTLNVLFRAKSGEVFFTC